MDDSEIDEIVQWQMTGVPNRKAPTSRNSALPNPKCPLCQDCWHGLPSDDCPGSFIPPEC